MARREPETLLNLLIDDLGSTLIRFDCFGTADWLDPSQRNPDGSYSPEYLRTVYTSQVFRDAWETFRYLNGKGIQPFLTVSGRIPAQLAGPDGQTLTDYRGYAEMVVSMAQWAREQEKLKFELISPFNETDLGFPEGPKLPPAASVPAVKAMIERMDRAGLRDVSLVVMDDTNPGAGYVDVLVQSPELLPRLAAFATHRYGNGGDEDGGNWFVEKSGYARLSEKILASPFRERPLWLTEYGDLDQTGEVEFGVAWRSTRRLLKALNDGLSAGLAWDAFDNLHEHDKAWATYGLLKTDRNAWDYSPKRRYYAAKQVYRYVRRGFRRVEIVGPAADPKDVFATWHAPLKHLLLSAFVSPDGLDFTVVGMSTVESDTPIELALEGLKPEIGRKSVSYFRTSREENCRKVGDIRIENGVMKAVVKENSIFTFTTVR